MQEQLPEAYIFDIDSTLALRQSDRKPFDYDKVDEDIPNKPIVEIYKALKKYKPEAYFFIITGRDEYCKEKTTRWLSDNGIEYQGLFMRPRNSRDLDANIKLAMFNEHIKGRFDVQAVFEDRKRCVKLFRDFLGLTVLQNQWGDY